MSGIMSRTERAIVFMAWGEEYIKEVLACIEGSILPEYDIILITDEETEVQAKGLNVIRVKFRQAGLLRKIELVDHLPKSYKSYVFLDSDIKVIADISDGFYRAEKYGIAMSPAPHYSLDCFWGFNDVMESEGVKSAGQLQYNTGVIFFTLNEKTLEVFRQWYVLGDKHANILENDQPYLSLAMEKCDFNPYTLSVGYNYRGFGDAISGIVRIWHSHTEMPSNINEIERVWPPRRVIDGKVHHMQSNEDKWYFDTPAWVRATGEE